MQISESQKNEELRQSLETPIALLRQRFKKQNETLMLEKKHFSTIITKDKARELIDEIKENSQKKGKNKASKDNQVDFHSFGLHGDIDWKIFDKDLSKCCQLLLKKEEPGEKNVIASFIDF